MRPSRLLALLTLAVFAFGADVGVKFTNACDGSVLVDAGEGYILSASDEDNVIRLYNLADPGRPVSEIDLNSFLKPEQKKNGRPKEADLEAVVRVGNRLYWSGSHGRDKSGNRELSRHRLFATEIKGAGASTTLVPIGSPYSGLLAVIQRSGTIAASVLQKAESAPHDRGGIDIEALAATSAGALLVGFKSPLVHNRALIVRVTNVADVVDRRAQPQLDADILLDLNGMGILDIASTGKRDEFFIVAGAAGSQEVPAIYRWRLGERPTKTDYILPRHGGTPDAILREDGIGSLLVAMDEGEAGRPVCKELPEKDRRFTIQRVRRAKRPDENRSRSSDRP